MCTSLVLIKTIGKRSKILCNSHSFLLCISFVHARIVLHYLRTKLSNCIFFNSCLLCSFTVVRSFFPALGLLHTETWNSILHTDWQTHTVLCLSFSHFSFDCSCCPQNLFFSSFSFFLLLKLVLSQFHIVQQNKHKRNKDLTELVFKNV